LVVVTTMQRLPAVRASICLGKPPGCFCLSMVLPLASNSFVGAPPSTDPFLHPFFASFWTVPFLCAPSYSRVVRLVLIGSFSRCLPEFLLWAYVIGTAFALSFSCCFSLRMANVGYPPVLLSRSPIYLTGNGTSPCSCPLPLSFSPSSPLIGAAVSPKPGSFRDDIKKRFSVFKACDLFFFLLDTTAMFYMFQLFGFPLLNPPSVLAASPLSFL